MLSHFDGDTVMVGMRTGCDLLRLLTDPNCLRYLII